MDAGPLQLDFRLNGATSTSPPICTQMLGFEPETGGFEAPSQVLMAANGKVQAYCGEQGRPPEVLQDCSWQELLSDSTQWWDDRRIKRSPCHPVFSHKNSKMALWLDNGHKPAWVDGQLALWDTGMKRSPESVSTSGEGQGALATLGTSEGILEVRTCKKLCEDERITEAADILSLLVRCGCPVPRDLFYRVLKRCIAHKDLDLGRRIHALSVRSGYEGDAFLSTHLIGLYASQGRLVEAMRVFTKVSIPDAHNWAAIIFAYARYGEAAVAVRLYRHMRESRVRPDNCLHVAVLTACATAGDLVAGKEVHAHILASPGMPDGFVQTSLVDMYAKCGSLEDARSVFDRFADGNVVTLNAMLAGYAQQGRGQEALSLYSSMQEEGLTCYPNSITFVCLLQACASVGVGALGQGKQLHARIEAQGLHTEVVLGGSLVNMYAKCGSLEDARSIFDRLLDRNVVSWNVLLAGYAQQGRGQDVLTLYSSMQQEGFNPPDSITFVCILQSCAIVGVGALHQGRQLHSQIVEQGLQDDVVMGGSLVTMYAKCGSLEDARRVFDKLPVKNVVAWSVMIAGYAQQEMGHEALRLYSSMQEEGLNPPNTVTYVCLLQACAGLGVGALHQGMQLHAQIAEQGLEADVVVGTCLIDMYAKCGRLEDARSLFDRLPERDVVAWSTMIAGYAEQGMGEDALSLYRTMKLEALIPPDSVTYLWLLRACAVVGALPLGKQLHAQIQEQGLQADVAVGSALVNMYAKCGSMSDSQQVFDSLPEQTLEAWNALGGGFARQGDSEVVFDLLDKMRLEGIEPNGITFLNVLTVCSHVGFVDKGREFFDSMSTEYGISPTIEHYICMMDLLGRAGHVADALQMAKTMPFPPTGAVWHSLLGACQKWNNIEIGQQAFEFAVGVDEKDAASYVLMSNIYSMADIWEDAKAMQARKKKLCERKKPGQSWWTDLDGVVHAFVVGDKKHPKSEGYARLEQTVPRMREGYVPHLEVLLL